MKIIVLLSAMAIAIQLHAQKTELGNDQFFKNNFQGIIQSLPIFNEWINAESFVYTKDGKKYLYNCKTNKEAEYKAPEQKNVPVSTMPKIVNKKGDLYWKQNNEDIRLTNDKDEEVNPTVSPDGKFVAYTKNNNLYTVEIATQKENQLTFDGSDVILNGYLSWVYMEEIVGRSSQYRGFWWSPDSKTIAYFRSDDSEVPIFTIADGNGVYGYVEKQRYPKAGDKNPEVKIGFVSPNGGSTTWADFNPKEDQYFGMPYWTPNSSSLWVNWMNRANNKLIIYQVNPTTGAKTEIYTETQETWIDLDDNERISFLQNGSGFLMLSDKTGWRHIYLHNMSGKLINPVTTGKFTVISIDNIDEKNKLIYFIARSRENTARRDYYVVNFNGKNLKRLTFGEYNHTVRLSPEGKYLVTNYSNSTTPNAMSVVNTKTLKSTLLGTSKASGFDNYNLAKTELIRVKSDDGKYDLPLKITWPIHYDKTKKYPVLISIYGGPDAGTVWDVWSLSGSQQWYAKEGLIQVAMDHRASGHFGKEGVNYMHRNLGHWELVDYSTMVQWLIDNASADPSRICITGFSYGGYISCLALVKANKYFTHAMAGGSVTDWTLYDSHYTEKLMDTPAENPEGYKTSSAIKNAKDFKGVLQLVHGVIDDNVHLHNSTQFLSALQDLQKDVEYMSYSGARHGWGGAKGNHFQNLKTKFIYKHLLQKPVPNEMLRK